MSSERLYDIRLKGVLDASWSEWFSGLAIIPLENGETRLVGPILDQAELHGLLNRIRDVGLTLVAVNPLNEPAAESSTRALPGRADESTRED